jgi:Asp/Glu/hydantoin racemase
MRILLILNGSPERYKGGGGEGRYRHWLRYCSPGTTLEFGYLPGEEETGGITRVYEFGNGEALAHAAVFPDRCVQAEQDGYDAAIMHMCADPGLAESRRRVKRMAVIGPGEATFRAGAILGHRIGMTVPSDGSVEHHREQIESLGFGDRLVGIEPINRYIQAGLERDEETFELVVAAATRLRDQGADVICPMGLALIPLRIAAKDVADRVGIPVIDPALVAVRTAEMVVAARGDA